MKIGYVAYEHDQNEHNQKRTGFTFRFDRFDNISIPSMLNVSGFLSNLIILDVSGQKIKDR